LRREEKEIKGNSSPAEGDEKAGREGGDCQRKMEKKQKNPQKEKRKKEREGNFNKISGNKKGEISRRGERGVKKPKKRRKRALTL